MRKMLAGLLAAALLLSGCTAQAAAKSDDTAAVTQPPAEKSAVQGGFTENQTLDGADGTSISAITCRMAMTARKRIPSS